MREIWYSVGNFGGSPPPPLCVSLFFFETHVTCIKSKLYGVTRGGPSSYFFSLPPLVAISVRAVILHDSPSSSSRLSVSDDDTRHFEHMSSAPVQATTQNEIWSKWDEPDYEGYINKMIKSWWLFTWWPSSIGFLVARRSRRTDRVSAEVLSVMVVSPPDAWYIFTPFLWLLFDLPGRLIIVEMTHEKRSYDFCC